MTKVLRYVLGDTYLDVVVYLEVVIQLVPYEVGY